jgi:hypothetical protein
MTTVDIRTLKSGDFVRCKTDKLRERGLKFGDLYRVTKTGTCRWKGYNYADIDRKDGCTFEVYYDNCEHFEIA